MILIVVKTVGSAKAKQLEVAQGITSAALRARIAEFTGLPAEKLKVVLHGKVVSLDSNETASLKDGDTVIAMVTPPRPPPPPRTDDQAEEELVFELPSSATWVERQLAHLLKHRLHVPDYLLVAVFWLRLRTWCLLLTWFLAAPLAHYWELGPLYVRPQGARVLKKSRK